MAADLHVPFLGRLPVDPELVQACDAGEPYVQRHAHTETAQAFGRTVVPILALSRGDSAPSKIQTSTERNGKMTIAIPLAEGKLSMHFGHCEEFALIEVDSEQKKVLGQRRETPPAHEPGVLPRWLHEQGADLIIAGGMGARAQSLFEQQQIGVVVGAPADTPQAIVQAWFDGTLESGANICDH